MILSWIGRSVPWLNLENWTLSMTVENFNEISHWKLLISDIRPWQTSAALAAHRLGSTVLMSHKNVSQTIVRKGMSDCQNKMSDCQWVHLQMVPRRYLIICLVTLYRSHYICHIPEITLHYIILSLHCPALHYAIHYVANSGVHMSSGEPCFDSLWSLIITYLIMHDVIDA